MANEKRLIDACQFRGKHEVAEVNGKLSSVILYGDIVNAPTVDAVEVVHGRWIASGCGFDCCSECRKVYADVYLTEMGIKPRTQFNYCPNCGAKMDGDSDGK